jgi:hypothetical protein
MTKTPKTKTTKAKPIKTNGSAKKPVTAPKRHVADGFLERDARLSPAERTLTVASMCEESTQVDVARALGISLSHTRNFVRLAKLDPAAWALFEKQGRDAPIRKWLLVCQHPKRRQLAAARKMIEESGWFSSEQRLGRQ